MSLEPSFITRRKFQWHFYLILDQLEDLIKQFDNQKERKALIHRKVLEYNSDFSDFEKKNDVDFEKSVR